MTEQHEYINPDDPSNDDPLGSVDIDKIRDVVRNSVQIVEAVDRSVGIGPALLGVGAISLIAGGIFVVRGSKYRPKTF